LRAGASQELAFQLTDAQFSVIAVATPGKPGVVIDRIAYSPYGEATRTLRSDVNGDGFVNQSDYTGVIKPRIGATIGTANYVVEADLDRNGVINQLDYDISIADDGKSSSGGVGEAGPFSRGVRNSIGYCGYIFNEDSGLYTVRFRTYSPTLGRWLERDPAGYVDGMGLYEYVRGGPIAAVDPWGLWTVPTSVMSRTISTVMQYLDCGIRICSQDMGVGAGGAYWGHEWLEWYATRPTAKGNPFRSKEAIGYYPKQFYRPASRPLGRRDEVFPRQVPCSSPLPAGIFLDSTLFGSPLDHLGGSGPQEGFNPESCGIDDPASGEADNEWQTVRQLRTRDYCDGVVTVKVPGSLQAGASRGTSCSSATCGQIIDCLRHVRPREEWSLLGYNCTDFVSDALAQCCLAKGGKSR
jgi:RHS repeat-associated protein